MAAALNAGDIIEGKYRIERQLGSGGMGVVFEATHLQFDQPVALKFLLGTALDPVIASERFLREARATFRLKSEHTVRVMDVGTLPSGEPFMVMERLVGQDFKHLLAERGPLPPAEAGLYMTQVCSALSEAHTLGIIHRDLKARNLFLTRRVDGTPCVKVLDFGISKVVSESDVAPLTQPEQGLGSPRYMAPEQWTSAANVDARADIYAAGAVLYELLTGKIPLAGLPLGELIKRARAGAVPSPRDLRPDLPDALCRAVMRAMRPVPDERFPTANHFAQAIRDALPKPQSARPRPILAQTAPTAVIDREVMIARAELEARLAATASSGPSSAVNTSPERPSARPPMHQATLASSPGTDFEPDLATVVTPPPTPEGLGHQATLQVAEAPPEIRALRNQYAPPSGKRPAPTLDDAMMARPARSIPRAPSSGSLPSSRSLAAAGLSRSRRVPSWIFWTLLVISFCFAGGIAAALATRMFM